MSEPKQDTTTTSAVPGAQGQNVTGPAPVRGSQPCRIVRGIFGRFFLAHPDQDDFGWSGSRWVPCTLLGIPTGITQVSNFATEVDALTYCASCGLVPVGPGPMSAPPALTHKSPMRESFDRIASNFAMGMNPLTRSDIAHLITLARAQVDANEPMTCGHAEKYAVIHIPGGTTCLMCEFARSRHGDAEEERA